MSAAAGTQAQFTPRLSAGIQLGDYVLGQALWPLRAADAYRANGPNGAATVFVVHAPLAANAGVRDMLLKKKQSGTSGFGARGTGNLMVGVCAALAEVQHGALAAESVTVSRNGRVRIADLALGPGTVAAMQAGVIPFQNSFAPERQAGGSPTMAADVYAVGALLYEALVGTPLERGGPRPSEIVPGTNTQIDEIVARSCH